MKNLDTSLLVFDIASVAAGYRALNEITNEGAVRILEASPLGARFMILGLGDTVALQKSSASVRAPSRNSDPFPVIDSELIEDFDPRAREALFALSQVELAEALVVVDCESVSGMLAAAQLLTKSHGLDAIEIRIQRSSTGGAYGFFTASAAACSSGAEAVRAMLAKSGRKGRVEVISSPSAEFVRYFRI